jgi:hypothetical protein
MNELNILFTKSSILTLIQSMNLSIDELQQKAHPNGKPYIEGMTKHVANLVDIYAIIESLEKQLIVLRNENLNYHIQVMKQLKEIEDLKKVNENLFAGL